MPSADFLKPLWRTIEGLQKDSTFLHNFLGMPSRRYCNSVPNAFKKGWTSFIRPSRRVGHPSEGLRGPSDDWEDRRCLEIHPKAFSDAFRTMPRRKADVQSFWEVFRRSSGRNSHEFLTNPSRRPSRGIREGPMMGKSVGEAFSRPSGRNSNGCLSNSL